MRIYWGWATVFSLPYRWTPVLIVQKEVGRMQNFGYLVADEKSNLAAVVDASFDARPLQEEAARLGVTIAYILSTHYHFDHVQDNARLARETRAKIVAHKVAPIHKDVAVEDGSKIKLGDLEIEAIHTPGHSPDSTCYMAKGNVFTGDTLFIGECGRCDFGDSSPEDMFESLLRKLVNLPEQTTVLPGHDYGKTKSSTIGEQKAQNYTLRPRGREEFVRFVLE
jgi:glyoxylase-like metal-dependent hydrolase (beta-lactamase superfamily II)